MHQFSSIDFSRSLALPPNQYFYGINVLGLCLSITTSTSLITLARFRTDRETLVGRDKIQIMIETWIDNQSAFYTGFLPWFLNRRDPRSNSKLLNSCQSARQAFSKHAFARNIIFRFQIPTEGPRGTVPFLLFITTPVAFGTLCAPPPRRELKTEN